MKQKDDYLWKGVLEDVFEDFLRLIHPQIDEVLDFSRGILFLDKELEQLYPPDGDDFTPKTVDKLAQVYTREGHQQWILIHVEIQGVYRKDFSLRMFTYYYRIFDKYRRPVVAYAVLTEPVKKPRHNFYNAGILGTSICYAFNLYKIISQNEQKLLSSGNPFAAIVLIVRETLNNRGSQLRLSDDELMNKKLELMRRLLGMNIPKKKIRGVIDFLTFYIRFENQENNLIFEEQKQKLTEGGKTMGLEELLLYRERTLGKKEGRIETAQQVAREMKADGISSEKISKYTGLSIEEIHNL